VRAKLETIRREALDSLDRCEDESALEAVRLRYLGKKGELTGVLRGMRDVPESERRAIGELANGVKIEVETRLAAVKERLDTDRTSRSLASERLDVTVPGTRRTRGRLHPLTRTLEDAVSIFTRMGFVVEDGPDVEDDYHNFEALNFPAEHPARDMQDTFFVSDDLLLRTHTSPVQIRVMETQKPPLRVIVPGTVYRHDDDATHSPMFLQIEGFLVDRHVTFGDLKGVLGEFWRGMFGATTRVRFRPSFFPFTEPSAEFDISCVLCDGRGTNPDGSTCRVCKHSGWLEVGGSGMIDPNVFRYVGYDPDEVSGFAFGLGVERIAMLRHGIPDIRTLYENDLRFLRQF
jgi:phenylalanyl-tRNA synthetase alpha chain